MSMKSFYIRITDSVTSGIDSGHEPSCYECEESLRIDKEKSLIAISKRSELGYDISHRYELKDDNKDLISYILEAASRLTDNDGWTPECSPSPIRFSLQAEYCSGKAITREGFYNRGEIPEEPWRELMNALRGFFRSFSFSELMSEDSFMDAKRPGEIMICGVCFDYGGKIYHYGCKDETVSVGDTVTVPVGENNDIELVTVAETSYHLPENAPYPVDKLKWVIH